MNKTKIDISEIDTVILAGGLGTRLRSVVKDKPKCLAQINGKPFIDILLDSCIKQGLRRFIICVGHLKEQVIEHLSNRNDCEIVFSEEDTPLGTGGALKNAEPYIKSNPVLVMNGDSLINLYYASFYGYHLSKDSLVTIAVAKSDNNIDYGSIVFDANNKIISFSEKTTGGNIGYINGGVYVFNKLVFSLFPSPNTFSLEHDFFPYIVKKECYAYKINSHIIDIGTPERWGIANQYYKT